MQLTILRDTFTEISTQGQLFINGEFFCYTLEDKDRDLYQQTPLQDIVRQKVFGQTCIPYGMYEVGLTYSNRFKKVMPQIFDVPGFSGIRIHNGNTPDHTEGCPLVGYTKGFNSVYKSRLAFSRLMEILTKASTQEKIFIDIKKRLNDTTA